MEKSALIGSDVNYDWNFLNYPIHTVSANPEQISKDYAILLIHGFGASTDHWRFNICLLYTSPSPRDMRRSRMPSSA